MNKCLIVFAILTAAGCSSDGQQDEATTGDSPVSWKEFTNLYKQLPQLEPGLFEIVEETRDGPSATPSTKTSTVCMSRKMVDQYAETNSRALMNLGCDSLRASRSGNRVSFRMHCSSPFLLTGITGTSTQSSDDLVTDTTLQFANGIVKFQRARSRRVGDCP